MDTEKSQKELEKKLKEQLKLFKEDHTEALKIEEMVQHKTMVHPHCSMNCGMGRYLVVFVLGNVDEIDLNRKIFFTLPMEGYDQEDLNENGMHSSRGNH